MKISRNERHSTIGVAAIGAVLLGAATLALVSHSPVASANADTSSARLSANAASAISPSFASSQKEEDKLPAFLASGPQAMDNSIPSTSRYLGSDGTTKVWAILSTDGKACVISLLAGPDQYASQSCADPATFAAHGLAIESKGTGTASRVYFVPEGLSVGSSGLRIVGPQLVAGDPTKTETVGVSLNQVKVGAKATNTKDSSSVVLSPLPSVNEAPGK